MQSSRTFSVVSVTNILRTSIVSTMGNANSNHSKPSPQPRPSVGGGDQENSASAGGCPVKHGSARAPDRASTGGCPVKHDRKPVKGKVYNVYSQEIDPTNQMPANPNNSALYNDQKFPLPQERVASTIPKGGTDETWKYPSPQMFFNALRRKGKGEDVNEEDAVSIVAVHNNMNERTWTQ